MRYTISNQANKKIQKDMDFICKEIKSRIKGVLSIILTGGFSRGEGPIKKIGKKFYPYNDYDIQVVSKEEISKFLADKISTEISQKLGYKGIVNFYPFKKEEQKMKENFYLDLKCNTPKELTKLLPRIRNYELKYKSTILWGKDLRYLIPSYDLRKLPLSEGAKLLLDRMSQMIEYYSTENKHDKENLTYFIQQAYAACCTSLLQLSGKYEIGYSKSAKILEGTYKKDFPELYEKIPLLHKKIKQFIEWKQNPKKLPSQDVKKEWFIARQNILEVSKYFFGKFLNRKIKTLEELADSISHMGKRFYYPYLYFMIKNLINNKSISRTLAKLGLILIHYEFRRRYNKRLRELGIKKKTSQKSPDTVIFTSLIYFIGSISEKGINQDLLKKGQKILNKVYPSKAQNWEEASIDYANAYIAFFLQKI